MKSNLVFDAALVLCASPNVCADDTWVHGLACATALRAAPGDGFHDLRPNENLLAWLGRHGWELAAIQPNHCATKLGTRDHPVYVDLFWFKRKGDEASASAFGRLPFFMQ